MQVVEELPAHLQVESAADLPLPGADAVRLEGDVALAVEADLRDGTGRFLFANPPFKRAFFGGVWEIGSYRDEGVPFDMTMVPGVFGPPTAYADSHSFVLPFQSSPDPERRRAVHALVAHVLKHSLAWADAGHIPAYTPVVEDPAYQELEPQSHYADAIDHLVYDPPAWFTGSGSDFSTYFGNTMQNVWARRTDPLEGWNAFVGRIDDLLAKPSPM